jgi:hypothetical protein
MYRQGDVPIIPVESIPENIESLSRKGGHAVLAHGGATGHAHAIAPEGAALFRVPDLSAVFMMVSGEAAVALTTTSTMRL